nr:S-adenosyl-L-methionine-dependent methyltransferase [Tanacetum cinerariifolium]
GVILYAVMRQFLREFWCFPFGQFREKESAVKVVKNLIGRYYADMCLSSLWMDVMDRLVSNAEISPAAAEAEAATMSILKRAIPDATTVAEANEIVRGNWLNAVELHHQQ